MFKNYTLQFWLLCLSTFLFFLSFNLAIPELPSYLAAMGGADYKGWIITLFTLAAAISRPFSGKLADTIGRTPVMIIGGLICVLLSVLYPALSFVSGFLLLRFLHGFSTGFMPTGTVAYLADIIPAERRGAAMGLVGIMNNLGFMAGNTLSSAVTKSIGINNLFYLTGILALISVGIIARMKETLPNKQRFSAQLLKIKWDDVWDNRAIQPSLVIMLTATSFGALLILIPDYSTSLGIENKGLFMLFLTSSTIITRFLTSSLSDKRGRAFSCVIGSTFWILSMLCLASLNYYLFFVGGVLAGMASGINSPALFAWSVDVAKGIRSGRAVASLQIALEVGIGGGALIGSLIYMNVFEQLRHAFIALAIINALGLFLSVRYAKKAR